VSAIFFLPLSYKFALLKYFLFLISFILHYLIHYVRRARGSLVIKALDYKQEGRGWNCVSARSDLS
jgi:hypothetical protein